MTTPEHRVIVAVLTYRRPRAIAALLPALDEQRSDLGFPVDILVVDNDPDGAAREVVESFGSVGGVRYAHEETPGIAAGRNRALNEAGDFDTLVFIDDDELPADGWLAALLDAHDRHAAAAITGPVLSRYEVEPGDWIRAGRFFDRRRHPSGTRVPMAPTSNLLLDLRRVREFGLRFDERFGISGGSDSLFTRQLTQRGGEIIWCDEAIVIDLVPASRLTREWVLQRAFRFGNAASRLHLDDKSPARRLATRAALLAVGSSRVIAGSARFAAGVLTGHMGHNARGLRTAARGVGMLTGSLGSIYHEYRRS